MAAEVIPFFFLNHRLEPARLRAVIAEIKAGGGEGFFMHAREGLQTPYLSREWFAALRTCLGAARRAGLTAWLYDEMPCPSGAAGGEVVRRRPELVEQYLQARHQTFPGGRQIDWPLGPGEVLACFARRHGGRRTLDLRDRVGPIADTWIRHDQMDNRLYYPAGPKEIFPCPRAACMGPENRLQAVLPAGTWELVAVSRQRGSDTIESFGQYVDVSNPAATACFIELTHEAARRRFGRQFARTWPGIFTDEPKFRHELPWGVGVEARVGRIGPELAFALAGDLGAVADVQRRIYRRVVRDTFLENWTKPQARWCRSHRLALTGHISPEEEWWYESRHIGSILTNIREYGVPGCDLIMPAAGDRRNALLNLTAGLAVSAAAQAGRPQALCEVFGACDFTLDLRTMKRIADWLACAGINVLVPHGYYYSLDGYRKIEAPPAFSAPAFAAKDMRAWADEFRAAAELLGPGTPADVLVVRPIDHLRGWPDAAAPRALRLVARGARLATALIRRGLRVHWIDDDEVARLRVRGGKFVFGRCQYRHLVYFREFTSPALRRRIATLARSGDVWDDRTAWARISGPLQSNGDVHAARRRDGAWFVANIGRRSARFELAGVKGTLASGESLVVRPGAASVPGRPAARTLLVLPDRWQAAWPETNRFFPDQWTMNGRATPPGPVFALQSDLVTAWSETFFGPLPLRPDIGGEREWVYRTRLKVRGRPAELRLVCDGGDMRGEWRATLNGRALRGWRAGPDFTRVCRLDKVIRPGANELAFHFRVRGATDGMHAPCRLEGSFELQPDGTIAPPPRTDKPATAATTRDRLGLGFYGGELCYGQVFDLARRPEGPAWLRFSTAPGSVVAVRLNGIECGIVRWAPDEVEITNALRPGRNRLELIQQGSPVVLTGRRDHTRLGARVAVVA